ncbi:GDF3 factor, partial [Prunella fulvescens]|nr:GDF3 factor [Prunella fulvescens]
RPLFVWASRAAMWLLRSLAWALLSPLLAAGLSPQESSLLKSLGLSAKPSPRSPRPVPPVLWSIFQKRRALPGELEPCRVEEFNVPGNIVRVFADQGTATPRLGFIRDRAVAPPPQEESLPGADPADAAGDGLWVWNPEAG